MNKKLNTLLESRTSKKNNIDNISKLANMSNSGFNNSFSGIFQINELTNEEKDFINQILTFNATDESNVDKDFKYIENITSEIKSISHQSILLHGERIRKAQDIFKKYKDNAFSQWLIKTYGNRQTPYNFLKYYLFFQEIPTDIIEKVENMPKSIIYSLSSRNGELENKVNFIKNYSGQTKSFLLKKIRVLFPTEKKEGILNESIITKKIIQNLNNIKSDISKLNKDNKNSILNVLKKIVIDLS